MESERFTELCGKAYLDGDYSYVNIALMANHEATKDFIEKNIASGTRAVTSEESYDLILMTQNMNSLLISVINRNMHSEGEAIKVRERLARLEYNVDTAKSTFESVSSSPASATALNISLGFIVPSNDLDFFTGHTIDGVDKAGNTGSLNS